MKLVCLIGYSVGASVRERVELTKVDGNNKGERIRMNEDVERRSFSHVLSICCCRCLLNLLFIFAHYVTTLLTVQRVRENRIR